MNRERNQDPQLVRAGTRVRESVRSLPKGHFQQIRQMFDKQTSNSSTSKTLSIIHEAPTSRHIQPNGLMKLPVTDDEKLQHSNMSSSNSSRLNTDHSRDYISEYQKFRQQVDPVHEYEKIYPSKYRESSLVTAVSSPVDTSFTQEMISSTNSSSPTSKSSRTHESRQSNLTSVINRNRHSAMEAAVTYTDSYQTPPSSHLKRTGSSRQFASSIQRPSPVQIKPVYVTTTDTSSSNPIKRTPSIVSNDIDEINPSLFRTSRRAQSSTSLSSTGYDSNSSPSIKSTRHSITTSNSNDFIVHSASSNSSTSSSSSSDEQQQKKKPWTPQESSPSGSNHFFSPLSFKSHFYDEDSEQKTVVTRTQIQLNPNLSNYRYEPVVRHAIIGSRALITTSPLIPEVTPLTSSSSESKSNYQPIIGQTNMKSSSYALQTTSFPDHTEHTTDHRMSRWNSKVTERAKLYDTPTIYEKLHHLMPTVSTGFQVPTFTPEGTPAKNFVPISEENREESPLPIAENPIYRPPPPKKPPRTFEQENNSTLLTKAKDQQIPSAQSSKTSSPTADLGTRSISCMDLTAGASTALLNKGVLGSGSPKVPPRPGIFIQKDKESAAEEENVYETLSKPSASSSSIKNTRSRTALIDNAMTSSQRNLNEIPNTPTTKTKQVHSSKSSMKKGVSEPNLAKTSRSKSPAATFFSPRHLIDRFKRMLPLSTSKQSLNEKPVPQHENVSSSIGNDSDETGSTSSETNDDHRTSRLNHVSRVKTMYDTLVYGTHMTNFITAPNQIQAPKDLDNFYEYVVHIVPESEFGFFTHGNGCLLSSNLVQSQLPDTNTIRFKYPANAKDESNLKYFCFPDQEKPGESHSNLSKKAAREFFRFTLTNLLGVRQYGYCSRFVRKGQLNALCLISPYDAIDLYEKVLSTATELFISYKDNDARQFLKEIYPHRVPQPGDTIHIGTTTVGLYTLKCDQDRRKELIDSITLLKLSTDTIVKIFSSILYEQKLIFISDELGPLTRLINTFICLLYPFSWPHTYIPILPPLMLDVIQAPTPYIIGILRSCESYLSKNDDLICQENGDILIVDIDHDSIRTFADYISHESIRGSFENLAALSGSQNQLFSSHILPKTFKIELKQEISILRKNRTSLSLEDIQQRLRDVFMSIFVQSCYNYRDYLDETFDQDAFMQSKQHTIALFLEWFTRTQIFHLFIRQKIDSKSSNSFALTFDGACDRFVKSLPKQTPQRVTVKSVKRKSATRANRSDTRM